MSTQVSNSFIRQYESDVHHIFQLQGGILRETVRKKDGIVGTSTDFQKIGKGVATTKARHGVITPMNQDHTALTCNISDFYAGDWVDSLDESKINIDERMAIAKGGAWALGRKVDDQIITELNTTSETTITITLTNAGTIRAGLLSMVEGLDANDVPNDGGRYAALTPRQWGMAMLVEEFASADYISGPQPFDTGANMHQGAWKNWMNVKWKVHTGLPGQGTTTANGYAWHKNAIGYACGAHAGNVAENEQVSVSIQYHNDHDAHFVMHHMSGGACMIDTTGVIEVVSNDTTAIPAS